MEEAITGTVYSSVPRKEMFITANIHSTVSKVEWWSLQALYTVVFPRCRWLLRACTIFSSVSTVEVIIIIVF